METFHLLLDLLQKIFMIIGGPMMIIKKAD